VPSVALPLALWLEPCQLPAVDSCPPLTAFPARAPPFLPAFSKNAVFENLFEKIVF